MNKKTITRRDWLEFIGQTPTVVLRNLKRYEYEKLHLASKASGLTMKRMILKLVLPLCDEIIKNSEQKK